MEHFWQNVIDMVEAQKTPSQLKSILYFFLKVQVGFCLAEGCTGAGRSGERVIDLRSPEGKCNGAPQPET